MGLRHLDKRSQGRGIQSRTVAIGILSPHLFLLPLVQHKEDGRGVFSQLQKCRKPSNVMNVGPEHNWVVSRRSYRGLGEALVQGGWMCLSYPVCSGQAVSHLQPCPRGFFASFSAPLPPSSSCACSGSPGPHPASSADPSMQQSPVPSASPPSPTGTGPGEHCLGDIEIV